MRNENMIEPQNQQCVQAVVSGCGIKKRKSIEVRKMVFNFVLENDDFIVIDLLNAFEIVKENEKKDVYAFLQELSFFEFIQGIKQGDTTRFIKVKI